MAARAVSQALRRPAWAALPVALVLLTFWPAVIGQRTLAFRDTDRLFTPVRTLVVEALRDGRLPLWNPHEATGRPLFAEGSHSVLHPLSLALAFLAPDAVDALLLAGLGLAALGAHLLARGLGASGPAAAAAGAGYALSGFAVSMTGNQLFLVGLSTLPWVLWAARLAGGGARWGPVATALATASAFRSGDTQAAGVGVALGLALAAEAGGRRGLLRALLGVGAGVLLAGVQVAATAALLPFTTRALPLHDAERTLWALHPARLLEWVIPGLVRGPIAEVPLGAGGAPVDFPFAESVHLGAPLLVAAALAVPRAGDAARRRLALVLLASAGVLLWLALGHRLGARLALDLLPVVNQLRFTEKYMAPLGLCLAALAALGVDAFAAAPLGRLARWGLAVAAAAAAGALAALLLAADGTRALAVDLLGAPGAFHRDRLAAGLPHLAAALAAVLAADRLRGAPARAGGLALAIALSASAASRLGTHLGDPAAHALVTPLRLRSDGPAPRLAHPVEGQLLPSEHADSVDASARQRATVLAESTNVAFRVDAFGQYTPLPSRRSEALAKALGLSQARQARRFAVDHVALPLPVTPLFRRIADDAAAGGVPLARDPVRRYELWAVPHRPWAFFAERVLAVDGPGRAQQVLLALMARGDDGAVALEAAAAPPLAPGRVLGAERRAERVVVDAEAAGPALLVVQDAWWPGWRAEIDGAPAELLPADVLVRAVPFPAGRHRLVLTYDPPEVAAGLAISGAGLLALLGLAVAAWRRRPAGGPGAVA
jgi:hypothetical protein